MGRQKGNSQRKEQEETPESELNELEASSLTEKEFRVFVIRMFKRMDEKYTQLNESYKELNENVTNMKRNQEEMKNDIAEIKNTMEGLKSRVEEAEDRISELEDKVGKNTQTQQQMERRLKKQEESLRELRDNAKRNNLRIIGIKEGEEEKQGIENLLEEIMTENFPDIGKRKEEAFHTFGGEHQAHRVTQYKMGQGPLCAQGKRRYGRKQSSYGGQAKPSFRKKPKAGNMQIRRHSATKMAAPIATKWAAPSVLGPARVPQSNPVRVPQSSPSRVPQSGWEALALLRK
ncbi:hypothetical protein QTO34_018280 [Cnephaeus nilssonii]|uniref:L1 transposable element RRM domain-containing protein n=1 Tax=Cnephaeus nilssonii TaxID=3371016 RepID=A0AA40HZC4_CNENI|nr:hypothetical protein QTO34_018280 [Eptesicus nilssonii]